MSSRPRARISSARSRCEPANAQAWLTLATVQQVTGDLDGAGDSCRRLDGHRRRARRRRRAGVGVDGVSGRAGDAYDALDRALAAPSRTTRPKPCRCAPGRRRCRPSSPNASARPADAERLYRASRALDPRDAYTIAAYADFLLDAGRNDDVLAMIPRDTPVDTLLLRRVQAAVRSSSDDAAASADELGQRFAALRARGDRVHLREEARYTLEILAKCRTRRSRSQLENWRVQKEPLDARIALEAALAAGKPAAAREVLDWIASTHLEGERIAALAREARP